MGIKGRGTTLLAVMILGLGTVVATPVLARSTLPQAQVVRVEAQLYQEKVECSGVIEMPLLHQVTRSYAVVPQEVCVQQGDLVQQGKRLLLVDREASLAAGTTENPPSGTDSQEEAAKAVLSQLPESYRQIAESMGLEDSLLAASGESSETVPAQQTMETISGEVLAPISGVVLECKAQAGVPSDANSALLTIGDTSQYIAKVTVGEEDISSVQLGDHAIIQGSGFDGRSYQGIVSSIAPVAQRQSGSVVVEVEIQLIEPDSWIKSGFSAQAIILTGEPVRRMILPYEAVGQDEKNQEYVFVWKDGALRRQTVVTGLETTDGIEIAEGLQEGEVVVLSPEAFQENAAVRLEG